MRKIILFTLMVLYPVVFNTAQEKEYNLDEVVITAGIAPVTFSNLSRSVTVLTSADIQSLPVNNITDILKYINAVDLKTRGPENVQADAGIRGGTFEQTLILIDGVKISDPQTGHHNLNIPVSLENVERIEVLKGQGSRIYGPNAFDGAINIITKKSRNNSLGISATGGDHNLFGIDVSTSVPLGILGNNFTFSKKKSDGYRYNTDFDITNFSIGQNYGFENGAVNILFGYNDKKFGANNFYSDIFPNQWEHTTAKILNVTGEFESNGLILSPKVYWRRHDDDYILDKTNPGYYHNIHKTYSYGAEIQSTLKTNFGATSFGGEINKDEIRSSNLGVHSRLKGGIFGEQNFEPAGNLSASVGFYLYNYSNAGWKLWPGIDAAYRISGSSKIFASAGKAFRIPTFTELYYVSPANLGNPNLLYEETTNYELGFVHSQNFFNSEISLFYKDGKNIIDWARASKLDKWKVENVTGVKTLGTEMSFRFYPKMLLMDIPFSSASINYTYLSTDRTTGQYESKYLLDFLKQQLMIEINNDLPLGVNQSWTLLFRDRINFETQFTIDSQINFNIKHLNIVLRAVNIFDKIYEDFPGVMLPGRWFSIGVKYKVDGF